MSSVCCKRAENNDNPTKRRRAFKKIHKLDDPTGWARFWNWLKMLNGPPHILWPFYDRPCYIDRGGVISASNMSQLFAERGTRQKWLGYDSIAAEWRRPVLYTQSRPFGALLRCRSFVTRRGEKKMTFVLSSRIFPNPSLAAMQLWAVTKRLLVGSFLLKCIWLTFEFFFLFFE